jgi:hypothetical protein
MANTLLRIGYISGSGGGGGISQYPDLASFPPTGSVNVLYFAIDTAKLYAWDGATYVEASPSLVTSVNTQVGDVVLDKSDVGLGNVDNTSDADKPISDDTQAALDALDDRIIPIEDRAEVLTVYAYENNTQVYADGQPGIKDPSALIRDGWYFKNSIAGQKINWYYFDGTSQGSITLGDFKSAYAVMTFDAVSGAASPIIAIYTFPTGAGDVIPGFAHSRIVYDGPMTPTPVVGKQYLVYVGENPSVNPELPRINLSLIPGLSIGDKLPTEQILTISFGSSSGVAVNQIQYMVETLGLFSDPVKHEMDLRIRVASEDALDLKVAKAGDTMSGLLDITVTGAAALEANDIVIGNPWGAGYSVITGKDGSTDALYIQSADQLGTFAGNSSKPVTVGSGYTQGANSGAVEVLSAPAAVSGASGSVYIHSGDTVGATGFTTVKSGNSSSSSTGTAVLRSGDAAVSSGNTQVRSGNSVANSGVTSLLSGQSSGGSSGQVQVQSGAAAVASGNILISSGSAATRGLVQIDGSKLNMLTSIDMNSSKITELLDPTDNQDAATKKYVDDKDALKQSLIDKNQANGYVGLNGSTKIDSIYLPSYVDDVLEFASLSVFPLVGETGIIYLALDTNLCYRWAGSVYVEISAAPVISVNTKVGAVVLDKTDIGLDQVDNTSDADKQISDATQLALDDKVSKTGDTMTGQLTMQDDSILIDASISEGMPNTLLLESGTIQSTVINGDITSTSILYPYQHSIQTTDSVSTSNTSLTISAEHNAPILEVSIVNAETEMDSTVNILNSGLYVTNIDYTNNNELLGNFIAGSFIIETILADSSNSTIVGDPTGITLSSFDGDVTTEPLMPATDFHVTVKKYVDDADDLKENLANKSIDGTLASNSDTLYPSQKAVKTYVDSVSGGGTANFEASTYYHELHVNYDFTGATSDGSPYRPFKTTQAAVNAAQLQNIGGNTAILIHLKNDINIVENIAITNAVSNLYIMPAVRNNTSSAPLKIIGSLTISGSQTNRVRVQDIEFTPTSGYALVINDTQGRHLFQNCGFVNGSVAGQAGTGVNLTSTYRNFLEFVDCTIEGTLNIAGTPVAGTTVLMYRCKLGYANVIVNSANIAVGIYDTYGIYGLTHTAGALAITGLWGIAQTGFFNSTATLTATNVLSLSNVSLQKPDLSFVALNKTGTCFYQLMNVHRGETADVLNGTRVVYGPTATDAGYKMGTSGNWPAAVSNVAGALDSLAANKIAITQKAAINGVASLDGTGKVPLSQLPASTFAADVLEFANLAAFPIPGAAGIVYVALDTNKIYRWNTTVYTELSTAPVTSVNGKTNVVTLNAIDVPFSPTATILSTDVQSAIVEIQAASTSTAIYQDTKEPTGFLNRTDSAISFVDGTRIFTIAPVTTSFDFYIKGTKFTKSTAQNLTIPNLSGNHYIYFNTSGVLESTQIFSSDIIEQNAFVSVIYWNTDLNTHTYFAEERHGITMDGATHIYLHTTFGARYLSGLALQGFTPDGNGSLDAHAQFTADEGSIRDEDILLSSAAQAQIPILFRQGQLWRKKAADAFPLIYSGTAGYTGANGRIPYNQFVAGSWQLTQVTSGDYVLVHFFATNDKENPIVGIQGIAQYNNAPQAKAAASTEITSLSGLPFAEFVAIGTVLFQTNTYANTPDARVVSVNGATYIDFRGTQLYTPAGEATTHSLLSGLSNDDHIQYHTDARGDIRYYTKAQVDTLITGITSTGDIDEKLFSISNSQALPDNVHNFVFSNSIVRAFEALVSIEIEATASLYETVKISGIQKGSDWDITLISSGDISGVAFSITTSGQIQYTSDNVAGFVSGILKFRAITTSV